MDKDFERKVKRKYIRKAALIVVSVVVAAAVILGTKIEGAGQKPVPEKDGETVTVTMEIRCDSLSSDMSKLKKPEVAAYVPEDGTILAECEVEIQKGASVYDVLDAVCRKENIHMESVYTPGYGAEYVQGIGYIYEMAAGDKSGWVYTVNGESPDYGCSAYELEGGERIQWLYTCDRGRDILTKPLT